MLSENQKYIQKWQQLDNEFSPWLTFGKDVATYIWPTGGNWLEEEPNQTAKVHMDMLDDTAEYSNRICAAGYMSGLCSPSRNWFELTHADKDLAKWGPVKEWFDFAEKVMYSIYRRSNWYIAAHSGFEEQAPFGTECMLMEQHPTEVVRFFPFTFGEYRFASSWERKVDTLYRKYWMTSIQMVTMFGKDNVSTRVLSALDSKPFSWFKVMHIIEPREERNVKMIDARNMPWKSVWIEPEETEKQLRVSGYKRFPAIAARWATRGQCPYGFGPGHAALGRSKKLQEFEKTGLKGLHKMVDPPMLVDSKFKGVLDLTPAATNYSSDISKNQGARPLYDVNVPLQYLEEKVQKEESRVQRAFFNDLFLMISQNTHLNNIELATQVLEMKEEKMLMLGPSVERQIKEKLEPSIDFVFDACMERGLFPPPPEELVERGEEMEVEFISVLAQAQKLQTASGLRAYLDEVNRVVQIDERAAVKTDLFQYLEEYGTTIGVPNKIIKSKDDVDAELDAIAQAQAQEQQMAQQAAMADAAQKLGGAKTDGGTALADLKKMAGV